MRKDHYSPPVKWTREFKIAVALGDVAFKVYSALESGPFSHPTGIYWVSPAYIAELVRETADLVVQAMDDLERATLIQWDRDASVVYVVCMCKEQYRWKKDGKPKGGDKRIPEAISHLEQLPQTHLLERFLSDWPQFRDDTEQGAWQGASDDAGDSRKSLSNQRTKGAAQGAYQGATTSPPCDSTSQREQDVEAWVRHAV